MILESTRLSMFKRSLGIRKNQLDVLLEKKLEENVGAHS